MNYRQLTRALIERVRQLETMLERREEMRLARERRAQQQADRDAEAAELAEYHEQQRRRALDNLDEATRRGDWRGMQAARADVGRHS